jgi:hypothetical protein
LDNAALKDQLEKNSEACGAETGSEHGNRAPRAK